MPDINPPSQNDFIKKPVSQQIFGGALNRPELPAPAESGFFRQNRYYILAIVVGLSVISLLAYFAFRKTPAAAPKEANVSISIDAPETLPSGTETLYKINIENNDSQKLTGQQLELTYPDSFVYISSSPKSSNLSGTLFDVPDLISGQSAALFVKVKASGAVNDEKILQAKLTYKYSNFNSTFVKSQSSTVRLVASDVVLELSGPAQANSAQLVIYSVKYQNNSDQDIKNARIKIVYPSGFEFASAEPNADLGNDTWNISSLAKGGSGNISVQGNFRSASPGESKTASAQFLILGGDGQFAVQNSSDFMTQMGSLPLIVSQEVVSSHPVTSVSPGDTLMFSVDYQNNNTTAATGVNIIAALDPKVLDMSTLRAEGAQISGSTITWNAASLSQLENLNPGETGHLSYQVKVKDPATRDSAKNLTVSSNIKIKSNEYDSFFPGTSLSLKVSSPSSLTSTLTYVSGSFPPQAGKDTVYHIKLDLSNSSNDYSNGVLTLFIPLGSGGYAGSVNAAENANVQYDQSAGKLTWNFGSLSAYAGRFSPARVLEFNIRLNPSSSQANTSPALVKNIQMSARDMFTGEDVSISTDDLNTANVAGQTGFGFGSVQP